MIPGLPENHTIGNATGAPYDEDIALPGIRTGNLLLMIAAHAPGQAPTGLDVSDFEVANDKISSQTQDTDGYTLTVVWTH